MTPNRSWYGQSQLVDNSRYGRGAYVKLWLREFALKENKARGDLLVELIILLAIE